MKDSNEVKQEQPKTKKKDKNNRSKHLRIRLI